MPSFESPLGKKSFPGQPLKEFTIPDESEVAPVQRARAHAPHMGQAAQTNYNIDSQYQNLQPIPAMSIEEEMEMEKELRAARQAKVSGKERLNDGAKRRIEILLNMVRTTREANILGQVFRLQSLTGQEMRDAIMLAAEYDNTVQSPFEIRKQLLARSLTHVAGTEIEQFIGDRSLQSKFELLDNLDESLLNRLFDEYSLLVAEAKSKFAIKNEEDVKEVIEDLKK